MNSLVVPKLTDLVTGLCKRCLRRLMTHFFALLFTKTNNFKSIIHILCYTNIIKNNHISYYKKTDMEIDELWKNRSSCTPSSGCAYQGSALLTEMD